MTSFYGDIMITRPQWVITTGWGLNEATGLQRIFLNPFCLMKSVLMWFRFTCADVSDVNLRKEKLAKFLSIVVLAVSFCHHFCNRDIDSVFELKLKIQGLDTRSGWISYPEIWGWDGRIHGGVVNHVGQTWSNWTREFPFLCYGYFTRFMVDSEQILYLGLGLQISVLSRCPPLPTHTLSYLVTWKTRFKLPSKIQNEWLPVRNLH